jgi:flagellar basal-body rod protein FlgF
MDKLIYVAMTGAKYIMTRQESVSHNLANVDTPGFRAQVSAFRSVPAIGDGLSTRTFAVDSIAGANFAPGPVRQTGRSLDIAIEGAGWIAVQNENGNEAYTRDGNLQLDVAGQLQTRSGQAILSDSGPITIPPGQAITIANDGTVSTTPSGQEGNTSTVVGRIKLVNPPEKQMVRGDDGLFQTIDSNPSSVDESVRVVSGALEGSNVNPIDAMVSMISLARQFDMQMKLLQDAEANARQATQLLSVGT